MQIMKRPVIGLRGSRSGPKSEVNDLGLPPEASRTEHSAAPSIPASRTASTGASGAKMDPMRLDFETLIHRPPHNNLEPWKVIWCSPKQQYRISAAGQLGGALT